MVAVVVVVAKGVYWLVKTLYRDNGDSRTIVRDRNDTCLVAVMVVAVNL